MEWIKRLLKLAAVSIPVAAASFLSSHEGLVQTPYRDVVGVITVCYGHTGADIQVGKQYSKRDCDAILQEDSAKAYKALLRNVSTSLTDGEKIAYISFIFNVGEGAFKKSTLLKKLNAGDHVGACNELSKWVYAGGKKWNGLVKRREAERQICLSGI
mgnify:CR=1 FL=1